MNYPSKIHENIDEYMNIYIYIYCLFLFFILFHYTCNDTTLEVSR